MLLGQEGEKIADERVECVLIGCVIVSFGGCEWLEAWGLARVEKFESGSRVPHFKKGAQRVVR